MISLKILSEEKYYSMAIPKWDGSPLMETICMATEENIKENKFKKDYLNQVNLKL